MVGNSQEGLTARYESHLFERPTQATAAFGADGLLLLQPPVKRRTDRPDVVFPSTQPVAQQPSDLPTFPKPSLFIGPALPVTPSFEPWQLSKVLVSNPCAIDNPVTVEGAAAEMRMYNANRQARTVSPDGALDECKVALANVFAACKAMAGNSLAPILPDEDLVNPDFSQLLPGTFERVAHLIRSNYTNSSRRSIKTAVRSWAKHLASLKCTIFRPNCANNPTLLAQEEIIRMTWLEKLVHVQGVQGSTAESYFSMMDGWHSEIMGYAPARSGIYVSRWIPKILRGIRREFPSKLKGREAHSVACFEPMRLPYACLFEESLSHQIFRGPSLDPSGVQLARTVIKSPKVDVEEILHQTVIENTTACLCRVGEAMPMKERMLKFSRADLSFACDCNGFLLEARVMIIPLKKSVRDRKFGRKIPIVIPARAGPHLKAAELLWLVCALIPCPRDKAKSTPMFLRTSHLRSGSCNQVSLPS